MNPTEKIKAFLKTEGITQTALADAYGVTPAAMSQFLNGVRPIPDMGKMIAAISSLVSGYVAVDIEYNARNGVLNDSGFWIRKG